ncbi:hypothetical protein Pelo_12946 [Pelomyxa schiedti]|nr:hypothetical protein Pelo_12946 [Pelomyxa schiedti]
MLNTVVVTNDRAEGVQLAVDFSRYGVHVTMWLDSQDPGFMAMVTIELAKYPAQQHSVPIDFVGRPIPVTVPVPQWNGLSVIVAISDNIKNLISEVLTHTLLFAVVCTTASSILDLVPPVSELSARAIGLNRASDHMNIAPSKFSSEECVNSCFKLLVKLKKPVLVSGILPQRQLSQTTTQSRQSDEENQLLNPLNPVSTSARYDQQAYDLLHPTKYSSPTTLSLTSQLYRQQVQTSQLLNPVTAYGSLVSSSLPEKISGREATAAKCSALGLQLVILGAGQVGCLIAGELALLGCNITVVDNSSSQAQVVQGIAQRICSLPGIPEASARAAVHRIQAIQKDPPASRYYIVATRSHQIKTYLHIDSSSCVLICLDRYDSESFNQIDLLATNYLPMAPQIVGLHVASPIFMSDTVHLIPSNRTTSKALSVASSFFSTLGKVVETHDRDVLHIKPTGLPSSSSGSTLNVGVFGAGVIGSQIVGELARCGCALSVYGYGPVPKVERAIRESLSSCLLPSQVPEVTSRISVVESPDYVFHGKMILFVCTPDPVKVVGNILQSSDTVTPVVVLMHETRGKYHNVDALPLSLGAAQNKGRLLSVEVESPVFNSASVKLVAGKNTSQTVFETAVRFFKSIGKTVNEVSAPVTKITQSLPPPATLPTTPQPLASTTNPLSQTTPINPVSPTPAVADQTCVVCLNAPRACAFLPCGHRCTCMDCSSLPQCPICRTSVTTVVKIYDA